ncbi:class I SAM-dependent methyltransferase [Streptomyces sp. NPDC056149]|uniref:class I SAM-dependent methyltransferase n=1 Tax=unclassified Streptomyces TaxID=2593676 RepID=UPI00238102B4|nr:class I SAM-dependent methyltransferase [Streptomyces sp. WZ-12]
MDRHEAQALHGGEIAPAVRAWYGPEDLGSAPAFAGGFINFGYWQGISLDRPLGAEDRIRSQRNLYRRVLRALGPGGGAGKAVEIGCGLGLGSALALEEFGFDAVTGMDIHPEQLARARRVHAELLERSPDRLRFAQGSAEHMPFADGQFDSLFTLEAAQHFRDLAAFGREGARVLRPGGRLVVSSFFVPDGGAGKAEALADRLESFAIDLDVAHRLDELLDALQDAGLSEVRVESIGEHVWAGFDSFLAGINQPEQWPRNFLRAYREGLLDYYVVTAQRPAGA